VTHWGISTFFYEVWAFRITFIFSSTVHWLLDNLKSKIMLRELTFENWWGLTESSNYWSEWYKHIIQVTCMINILCFISNLEAWITHTKMHCIHINVTWIWLINSRFKICIYIFVNWRKNYNFFLSSFTYRLSET
jgi:hypothetical protein